jgi:ribosomal-protein-alanine N-acetyltransferase
MSLNKLTDIPSLQTPRLLLREVNSDDANDIFEFASDRQATKYTFLNTHRSIEDTEKFILFLKSPDIVAWAIVLRESEQVIGYCFFHSLNADHRKAEIEFGISREYWGQGYATEAARKVLSYGFEKGHLRRIEGTCMLDNLASSRVLEKLGMKFEKVIQNARQKNSVFYDLNLYILLSHEHTP